MKRILSVLTLAVCAIFMVSNASAQDNYNATTMGEIVRYYETAKWGQQSPFNNQIYTEAGGSTHGAAGCVPTAYAIIMRYWGFPTEGTSSDLQHCQTGESITDRTYDWSKMPLTNGNGWTEEQKNEVSKLFAHVLHAVVPANIGQSYTDANEGGSTSCLETHFGYTYIASSQQWQHEKGAWEAKMKESLDNGCPIPYASKNTGTGDARHMFVIDGYTTEGYYHINFGWNGYANGWHKLDEIKPADSDGNLTGDNYSWVGDATSTSAHKAFFNLAPKTEKFTVTATATPSNMGTVSINGGTAGTTASAEINENFTATLTAHPADGYALASWTKNGEIVGTKNTLQVKVGTSDNEYVANFDDEANVYVTKDYTVNPTTGNLNNGTSKSSIWAFTTSNEYPAELTIKATDSNGSPVTSMTNKTSGTSGHILKSSDYIENTATKSTAPTKYTLSVSGDYVITGYDIKYYPSNGSITVNNEFGHNETATNSQNDYFINVDGKNVKSTWFTIDGSGRMETLSFVVHIQSNAGGSTPTPTTYLINATAGAGGSVTINGEAVSQKNVNENSPVTVVATPQTGYRFVNWTSGTSPVSTDATYSFTATGNTSLVANFEQTQYTVTVAAGEGGVAYIDTEGTTEKTVSHNENVTITAEANDGYRFVEWRAWNSHFSSIAQQDVTVTTDVTYTAVFEPEAAEPEQPEFVGTKEETSYTNANWFRNSSGTDISYGTDSWGYKVVTENETSTVTLMVKDRDNYGYYKNNLGFRSVNGVNHPFLFKGTTFTISVPEQHKITGYSMTVVGENFNTGTVTYTTGAQMARSNTSTATISGTNPTTLNATGLDTNSIEITLGSATAQTAGVTITNLDIYYEESEPEYTLGDRITSAQLMSVTKPTHIAVKNLSKTNNWYFAGTTNVANFGNEAVFVWTPKTEGVAGEYYLKTLNGEYLKATGNNTAISYTEDVANAAVFTTLKPVAGSTGTSQLGKDDDTDTRVDDYNLLVRFMTKYTGGTGDVTTWINVTHSNDPNKPKYYNGGYGMYTAHFVYAVSVDGVAPEIPDVLFPDGAYKIYWQADNRGYLAYHATARPDEAVLADVTYTGHAGDHYNSSTDPVDLVWYLITASNGKRYLFQAATGSFLGANPSIDDNGIANKLSTTEAWPINVEKNTHPERLGHYIITTVINGTNKLLCSGCGTSSFNGGHSVRWLTVNDNNQKDGGAPLQLISVNDVTVSDDVMNAVRAVIEPRTFKFKAEIENWRNDNPNTHLGTITIGGTAVKLTPAHQTASELTMPLAEGTTLAFTRKYRGFEFNGFYIGETSLDTDPITLTADNVAAINETTPLVAKFTATDDVTLFYDDDTYSYRIPAIAKTGTNRLVAVSDYRHSHDDIGRDNHHTGTYRVDLVMRTSDDNGKTWEAKQTIAEGTSTFGYGDAAIAANGEDILVMAVAGKVFYPNATARSNNKTYRIYSNDNGEYWTKEEVTSNIFGLFDEAYATFFGSGKLAVDPDFNGTGKARVYGAILLKNSARSTNNYVLFSDDWGATWNILGGSKTHIADADEPKVEILPNGQILLSSRNKNGGSRVFNVFTYGNDKAAGEGTWGTAVSGCINGGSNGTNGEIICLDAKRTNGKPTKILLQSQPKGGSTLYDRKDVTIWYKEVSADETYTADSFASGWNEGLQVSTVQSAYSAMALQANGEIAFFFEEAPCHNDDNTYGYSMVYVPLTIEETTGGAFLNPNANVEYVPVEFNIVLTDAQGNEYLETLDYIPADAAAVESYLTGKYPFITLGTKGAIADNTYTNTVTLPFKVSNANTTVWYNIYWPSYNPSSGKIGCPVYLSATDGEQYVPKVTADALYGASEYNTLEWADRLSWAVYSVNNSLTFKFKNKSADKYIKVTSVASGNAQNTVYADEANATVFTLLKDTGTRIGDYALAAEVGETTGYLCSTSATGYNYATHFNHTNHEGAWVVFKEEEVVSSIQDLNIALNLFGEGALHVITDEVQGIITALESPNNIKLNTLDQYGTVLDNAMTNWKTLTLTVNDAMGSVTINNESRKTKKAPSGFEFTVVATPASGYSFVNWTKGTEEVSTDASYTFNMPDAETGLTANFVKDDVGYYHLISRATGRHEHLYNNVFSSGNTNGYTLQSDNMVNTNNGIWRITKNGNQWKIKNGDGKPVVAGNSYNNGIMGTYSELNIHTTIEVDGYTYYYFSQALNCSDSGQGHFKVGGINYLTTWSGHSDATDNQWRLERVDTEGKNIYDVVVECTDKENVYVTYGSEYAFNGGFFITTDATITAGLLTVKKGNDAAQGVTVRVEDNTIRVVDAELVDITVSATPAEGGTVTINGETASTSQVIKDSEVTVVATPAIGYHFVNWTKGTEVVSTDASYTFTIDAATVLTANFDKGGYYHLISKDTNRHEHLYNNAFSNGNTNHLTLQSNEMVITNNGIWYITAGEGSTLNIKNGDGKPVVAGNDHEPYGGIKGTFSELNIHTTIEVDGYTYYYFSQALNCSNVDSRLKVGDTYYLTTWSDGGASADDNLWRLEPVDTEGKNIYDVVVECTDNENVYVTYGSEYAFNGGFFITDATIEANQLTAKKGNNAAQGVKVLVDGNTIKVVDKVYYTITVSTYYNNSKGGTVKVGEGDATSVNVAEGEDVRMLATAADGYEFMGWLKDGILVKNAIGNSMELEIQGHDYTLYKVKASAEYKAVFSKITDYTNLEDGKAYRICAVSESCAPRYIYRVGNELKWKNDDDNFDDNSIFVVQKNGNSVNLISAIGYHGWKASNKLGNDEQYDPYAAIKVTYGTKEETRSLYLESGTSSGIYTTLPDNVFAFMNTPSKSPLPIMDADNRTTNFLFEEVTNYAFQVSAADGSNAKLGTVNLPFATTVPDGVKVYGIDDSNETHVYVAELELSDKVLPANTPVLIEATDAGSYGFKPAPASAAVHETGFAGTLEAETIPGDTNAYILSYKGMGTPIKMYKLSSTDRTINANKAYYIEATGKASALQFVFGGTTDIEEAKGENGEVEAIYDLQGRKLSEITEPGMYIINGKKVYKK